jgi:heme-degrading monooxygenase HmoA
MKHQSAGREALSRYDERRATEMTYVIARHNVEDYPKWKAVYDEHAAFRKETGSTGARVLQDQNDPTNIIVLTEWPSMEQAHQFAQSPSLHEAMGRAGVVGRPDIYFVQEVDVQPA